MDGQYSCPVCGGVIARFGKGHITANKEVVSVDFVDVIHPVTGLRGCIEASTIPDSGVFEETNLEHGKIICINDESHTIPISAVKESNARMKERSNKVPMITVSGGLSVFRQDSDIQEDVLERIMAWHNQWNPRKENP